MPRKAHNGAAEAAPPAETRRPGVTLPPIVLALGAAIILMIGFAGGYIVATNVGPDRGPAPPPQASSTQISPELAILGERLQRDPNDVQALLRLAHVHLDQGQQDAAKAMYERVLQLDPRNAEAITHLGNVVAAQGRPDDALKRYDEALAIDPKYLHALWDKAILLHQTKATPAAAVPVWEAILTVVPPGSPDGQKAQEMLAAAKQGRVAVAAGPADAASRPAAVEQASLSGPAAQGKMLYEKWGCPRCHAIAGRGGSLGPDLTRTGSKPGRDVAWHIRHFKNPAVVVPGSVMPPLPEATEEELRALAEYMVSLK